MPFFIFLVFAIQMLNYPSSNKRRAHLSRHTLVKELFLCCLSSCLPLNPCVAWVSTTRLEAQMLLHLHLVRFAKALLVSMWRHHSSAHWSLQQIISCDLPFGSNSYRKLSLCLPKSSNVSLLRSFAGWHNSGTQLLFCAFVLSFI